MDSKFFRVPTKPNYYESLTDAQAESIGTRTVVSQRNTVPTPDSRFPGWAGPMADGRLVTDYRPHCNENVPAGAQYAVKEWIQQSTDKIIDVSRQRQAKMTGAVYGTDPTVVPPPVAIVQCKPTECFMAYTGAPDGIGVERSYDTSPPLFGTFVFPREKAPRANIGVTQYFEGGRNSPRGRYFKDMGTADIGHTALKGTF
jgi:hypothetical protein